MTLAMSHKLQMERNVGATLRSSTWFGDLS